MIIIYPFLQGSNNNSILMDDYGHSHRYKMLQKILHEGLMGRLDWPLISTDMNPIEYF